MDAENSQEVIKAILRAKGIIVIIGAGVSVEAGVPSFRGNGSLHGVVQGSQIREVMSAQIRLDEALRKKHANLIATLASKTVSAKPTPFHWMLRALENENMLIRLYTQNIDGLEGKVGFDLMDRSPKARCIALHGTLTNLRCNTCSNTKPLEGAFHRLKVGDLATCSLGERALSTLRQRTGNCGTLYPDIALYGDPVKDEDYIIGAVNLDLKKITKHTILLVVGTSLNIPGVAGIIRTLSDAIALKGGQRVYLDMDPNVPDGLRRCFNTTLKVDCQAFAQQVLNKLKAKGIPELRVDAELRKDVRPLWDWGW